MRIKVLSDNEVQVLLTYLGNYPTRDNLIIRLMLQCGLRAGEVTNLDIESVWRGGYVNQAIYLKAGTTKGHIPRYVDMPEPVKKLVENYIKAYYTHNPYMEPTSPLFLSYKQENRLHVRDIERITGTITKETIGRSVNPHQLRHTFATILMKHTNIRVVQTLLGHANLNTTQIYTHPSSEDCKTAVNQAFNR